MRLAHGRARRVVALAGTIILLAGTLAVPAGAGAGGPAPASSFRVESRSPVATGHITMARAQRLAREQPRTAHVDLGALPRPDSFAGRGAGTRATIAGTEARPLLVGPAGLLSTRRIDGITSGEVGDLEPPDTFVAVSASWIVETTNGMMRVWDRNGVEKASVASWALFGVLPGYFDTDPRILWDAIHGRWVAVLIWFDGAFSENYLTVLVSAGSDPLGAWDSYTFDYGPYLPDYPSIASSSNKIVVTANEFENGATYAGSSFLTIPWPSLLTGEALFTDYGFSSSAWNLRPGRVVGTTADLHLVYENDTLGTLSYLRLTGPGDGVTIGETPLTYPNNSITLDPRQPGDADGISRADDGRIADAVWWNDQLWFSRTVEHAWDGINDDMAIEVLRLGTSPTAAPTEDGDVLIVGPAGSDQFTSGIGASTNGTVFLTFSRSSTAEAPSLLAVAYHQSLGWQGPITIAESDASYVGQRWGDYAGIAPDPLGGDAVWQGSEVADADGYWATVISRLVFDVTVPTAVAPRQSLITGTTLASELSSRFPTVPVKVSWSATDPGSGITTFDLDVDEHGGGYATAVSGTTATSAVRNHTWKSVGSPDNSAYGYGVLAFDDGRNPSNWMPGATLTPTVYQQTDGVTFKGTWKNSGGLNYSGGSVKYSSSAGASATFKASGSSFGFVTTKASTRGKVKVFVDGSLKATLTLGTSSTSFRNLAYTISFASSGSHTIKLVVVKGRVDVDAFAVLR